MTDRTRQAPNHRCQFCSLGITCDHGFCDLCQSCPECTDEPDPDLEILDCGLDWAMLRGRPLTELGIAEIAIVKTKTGEQVGTIEGFTVLAGKPLIDSLIEVARATCPPGCHVLIRGVASR